MVSKTIKGLTVEIGGDTTELGKALDNVDKKSRSLSGELGNINRLLKLDPKNVELLTQKQKVLAEAIGNTEDKLKTLREAEKVVQAQFEKGKVSEAQYRDLRREIVATENKLKSYKSAAEETQDAINKVGKNSRDTSEDVKKLSDSLSKGLKVGLAATAAGVAAATAALVSSVEATQEYRTAMGKLNTAFETQGHKAKDAAQTYESLQSILGETDQAVEAANHLALLTDNTQDLQTWTEICTGVFATFGDSLPIEGLTEAANETAKVGQVTGPLADALNWAGISEDAFNESLADCSDEQERQRLIMTTLNGVYAKASSKYKEINKDVIESNKNTERLNKLWARVGSKAAPIVNTFKKSVAELGESLLNMVSDSDIEDFQETVEKGFNKLAKDVIPGLINALKWCADHFNEIKSVAVGFIAALAVGKITSFASSLGSTLVGAVKGLTSSLKGAKVAQEGMNAAASANPYILLAQAIIGVAVALGSYVMGQMEAAKEAGAELTEKMYGLSDAEQAAADGANKAAEAFKNQRESMDAAVGGIASQYDYVSSLTDELLRMADADGQVDEANRTRAQFIINELNKALGTEYTMTQNQIDNYRVLKEEITKVIEAKKNELLLAANSDAYAAALKNRKQAEDDYYKNLESYQRTQIALAEAEKEAQKLYEEQMAAFWPWEKYEIGQRMATKYGELEELKRILDETGTAYDNSKTTLAGYYNDIGQYETAQMLTLQGNTEEANKVLTDRSYYVEKYADSVGFASDEVRNTWEQEAIDAGIKAELIKKNWLNGVAGYTDEMVTEAETNYKKALAAMDNAYNDASKVGSDVTSGLSAGMESGRGGLMTKARSLVQSVMASFRKEADSHSPSRKMIALGEDMDEGLEIGLEGGTKSVLSTASEQMRRLMGVYNQTALGSPAQLRAIESPQLLSGNAAASGGADSSAALLGQILDAIKSGQVLTIDGRALVGATADLTDQALGQRRALAARGAV